MPTPSNNTIALFYPLPRDLRFVKYWKAQYRSFYQKRLYMPRKATQELQSLVNALAKRNQNALANESPVACLAAGTTRLGKIEFVQTETDRQTKQSYRTLHDTLLIRIRQNKYSSVAILETKTANNPSCLRIHAEHEIKISQSYEIPFRTKRPRFISIGIPKTTPAEPLWFKTEF
ncbi:MAG: hypothetical protein HN457_07090 [Opitutales bacterium]|nr:hypothetical protein [Opitutales bacterium]MBT5170363.1 hypothetical protein [Opitutales bacterium]MBT5816213.1 hypothetical protein [Opitutales bacterium]MBT6769059.1 hypothetical protein [Opitutales bacterium]MBT7864834.1 hypothetical protein [Opitutales bacterium]